MSPATLHLAGPHIPGSEDELHSSSMLQHFVSFSTSQDQDRRHSLAVTARLYHVLMIMKHVVVNLDGVPLPNAAYLQDHWKGNKNSVSYLLHYLYPDV